MGTTAAAVVASLAGPVLAAAALFALVRGRRCERLSAAAVLLGLGFAGAAPAAGWAALAGDAAVLAALMGVALVCKPVWTLFAAAFQLLTALTRLLALIGGASPALDVALQAWAYALAAALVVGGWRARRRRPTEPRAPLSLWGKVL